MARHWTPTDAEITAAVRRYVDACCEREHPPRINEVAKAIGVSRRQVGLAVKRESGITAIRFIRELQISRACAAMRAGLPLKQVIYRSGFRTRRPFFRTFKRITGLTPRQYRKEPA